MKRAALAAAVLAGGAIWLSSRPLELPPEPERAIVRDEVRVTASAPEPKAPIAEPISIAVPVPARRAAVAPERLRGNFVEYEVINGLAIAYGDVIIGKARGGKNGDRGRHEMKPLQLWPSRTIPYYISPDLPNPDRVLKALAYFEKTTVVRFTPYLGSGDGIGFERGDDHCFTTLGRQGGLQPVKLADGCGTGEIIHEIMHVLGFVHEQSRPDRDRSIEVLWDNIEEKYRDQYDVVPDLLAAAHLGSDFDFRSAMLYRQGAFARQPGMFTMRPRDETQMISPMNDGLSMEDVRRVNRLYGGG